MEDFAKAVADYFRSNIGLLSGVVIGMLIYILTAKKKTWRERIVNASGGGLLAIVFAPHIATFFDKPHYAVPIAVLIVYFNEWLPELIQTFAPKYIKVLIKRFTGVDIDDSNK